MNLFGLFRPKPLAPWQRWGLAAGGVLTRLNNETFEKLACNYNTQTCRQSLKEWWGVNSTDELESILLWLYNEGHRLDCQRLCQAPRPTATWNSTSLAGESIKPELRQFLEQHSHRIGKHGLVSWDLSRLVNVARWGHKAGYIDDTAAWKWIHLASLGLQESFSSWEETGEDFLLGYRYWSDGGELPENVRTSEQWLNSSAESPWRQIPWNTKLN